MKKSIMGLCIYLMIGLVTGFSQTVYILVDNDLPQAGYATKLLSESLLKKGYQISTSRSKYDYLLNLDINAVKSGEESYRIIPDNKIITINGGDANGLLYGCLSLKEKINTGVKLGDITFEEESPVMEFRGIKHNLPWDAYRANPALEQHYEAAKDLNYWKAFLDMMVENRFNVLSLWNLHPFTYMIQPKNFPEASPFSDSEFQNWQALYRGIFAMAKERGIETYLVNWSIFVSEKFAKTHNVASDNFYPNFYVNGDTTEIVKRYTRESVTQVLEEYPDLTGFAISHGEGMGGMTPKERQEWMNETMIEGMRLANRKVKFIHRVPFSANLGSGGSTSRDTEILTREAMESIDYFDGPIWVEMKFNWSHAHSTPDLVKVHGGKLGDTYFVPEPKNYKITWMARNEDFFTLRWGVPDFIRSHISKNNHSYVGGYFVGSEGYIPVKDYFTSTDKPVNWKYAFQRQWLFYKLWGRLLYNPDTPDKIFQDEFVRKYGNSGTDLLEAYALSSSTQLRLASVFDSTWDLTLYGEGFLSLDKGSMKYISVDRLINQKTMDPNYISIRDFVASGASAGTGYLMKISPLDLADRLEMDCMRALALVADIDTSKDASLLYEVSDVQAWSNLGLHLAEKLRGAVQLETFRKNGEASYQNNAVKHLEKALAYWDQVIAITRPIYKDMPLTPYLHNKNALFHWEHLRPSVAEDISIAKSQNPVSLN
ncbi:glycoside hydrolase family 20 zincin-like fold domain-containing protein [Cognataquiflexum rubidum]|uniref:glycoside hydrolase family 20 zincin-like fold domain-containing protein n=1 Tax=Cognataquiflexum rubidum TaxID=2922273 RepID=UPI001F13601B|nr:glycoside hydrolase family 20 zincin-like fold domain-containing protein [Cognataquiflexum rubidum]MCH6233167.1 glycoside hydrolase family 20 zincin-like fold domain-containing protein [Cognataquiflexum rubidum]